MFKLDLTAFEEMEMMQQKIVELNLNLEKFIVKTEKLFALKLLDNVIERTTVTDNEPIEYKAPGGGTKIKKFAGGALRRGWIGGTDKDTGDVTLSDINNYLRDLAISKNGNTYKCNIENTVSYAPYVEYGHKQNVGQFVPFLGEEKDGVVQGARLKESWVDGQFMLKKSVNHLRGSANALLRKSFADYIDECFKSNS